MDLDRSKRSRARKVNCFFRNFSCWTEPIHSVLERDFRKFCRVEWISFGKLVAAAFIDFRNAFDSVPHATLIMKLERHFGIKGSTLDWLKSYLTGRKQLRVLNGVKLDFLPVSKGIPQGSTLVWSQPVNTLSRKK